MTKRIFYFPKNRSARAENRSTTGVQASSSSGEDPIAWIEIGEGEVLISYHETVEGLIGAVVVA